MPTYDYECTKCGHTFEVFQSMRDKHLTKCPTCSGKVKRLVGTGAGLIFKGGGFYQTDYRSSAYRSAAKADQSKSAAAETPASTPAKSSGTTPAAGTGATTSSAKPSGSGSTA